MNNGQMSLSFVILLSVGAACSPVARHYDLEDGYSIRHEKDRSVLLHGTTEVTTDMRYSKSPSGRYVLFRAYGNLYLFDAENETTRFLRRRPFSCMDKWYERADPPVIRCFDVHNDRMVEIRL